jgi:hypothetical protein
MSISTRFTKVLAVTALAVAGVVGMAGAADKVTPTSQVMSVGYTYLIEDTAFIEIAKSTQLDKKALLANNTGKAGDSTDQVGTLGIIRVTTTRDAYTVTMKTKWGGKLVDEGTPTPTTTMTCPANYSENPWNTAMCSPNSGTGADVAKVPVMSPGVTKQLLYKGKSLTMPGAITGPAYDTVQLHVRIGVCDLGADLSVSAVAGNYYSFGSPDATELGKFPPALIDAATLTKSRQYNADGSTTGVTTNPVNFATLLGTKYSGETNTRYDWSTIKTAGKFPTPKTPGTATTPSKKVQYFYINVGIANDPANTNKTVLENKATSGNYSETFTFELVADA